MPDSTVPTIDDAFFQEFGDFIYYFGIEIMATPNNLQQQFLKQFRQRILQNSEVTVCLQFDTSSIKKEFIKQNTTYETTTYKSLNRKEIEKQAPYCILPGPAPKKLSTNFFFELGENFTTSKTKDKKLEYQNWSLTIQCKPTGDKKAYLYDSCKLTIFIECDHLDNPLTEMAIARLNFLQGSIVTLNKIAITFFSHLNSNISAFNHINEYSTIKREIDRCVELFSKQKVSDVTAITEMKTNLEALINYKDINYLDQTTLIGKTLIFLVSIISNDTNIPLHIKQATKPALELLPILNKLLEQSIYNQTDVQYFAELLTLLIDPEQTLELDAAPTTPLSSYALLQAAHFNQPELTPLDDPDFKKQFDAMQRALIIKLNLKHKLDSTSLLIKFCFTIYNDCILGNKKISQEEVQHINQSANYVLCELLRSVCFEQYFEENHFMCQPSKFATHILNLLFCHAEKIIDVHIPTKIKTRLYAAIDERDSHNLQIEFAHLQHCIDIYVAGIELFNKNNENLYNIFATTEQSTINIKNLLRSFALAVFAHDIGMLAYVNNNNSPNNQQEKTKAINHSSLLEHGILSEEEIDELDGWFKGASSLNNDSVSLLERHTFGSANFLLAAADSENKFYDSKFIIDKPSVLTPALKAIVYHATPQHSFAADKEPVSALVALLDELFEWEHSLDIRTNTGKAVTAPLRLHLPVQPYSSHKGQITYDDQGKTFRINLISDEFNSNVHMEVLRLAQMYGRFLMPADKPSFFIELKHNKEQWCEIMEDIANAVITTETSLKPLLLSWSRKQREKLPELMQDNGYVRLQYLSKPFANIDVKHFYSVIENYMTKKINRKN